MRLEAEGIGQDGGRLLGATEVAGIDGVDGAAAQSVGEQLCLAPTLPGQNGFVCVALDQSEHVPRALPVPDHPDRLVSGVLVHGSMHYADRLCGRAESSPRTT